MQITVVGQIDEDPFSSFHGRPSSASLFHTSHLQVTDGVWQKPLTRSAKKRRNDRKDILGVYTLPVGDCFRYTLETRSYRDYTN